MTLKLGMVTLDTTDPLTLGRWWAEATGGQVIEENDGWFVIVSLGGALPHLAFQKVDDPTAGKNRLHLDLGTADVETEVAGLLTAGATEIARHEMDGFGWVVLADPDGNQFCVAPAH